MKNGIKIAIIAFVAIILVVVIVFSIKDLSGGSDRPIAVTPFEKTVENRVEKEIEGKDYLSAGKAFTSIMNYINTETSIKLADGSSSVNPEEAAKAKEIVFSAYAPMVVARGNELFARPAWVSSEISAVASEAAVLAKAGGDPTLTGELNNIVNTAQAYKEALGVVASAKSCSSISNISTLIAKADNFKRAPLTNNTSLMASLNQVGPTAKAAVVSSLYSRAASLSKKATSYGSWNSFLNNYNSVSDALDSYINAYGVTSKISEAYSLINSAYNRADSYYNTYYYDSGSSYDYDF